MQSLFNSEESSASLFRHGVQNAQSKNIAKELAWKEADNFKNQFYLFFSMKRSSRRWKKKRQMRWKWQRKRLRKEKHKRKLRRARSK